MKEIANQEQAFLDRAAIAAMQATITASDDRYDSAEARDKDIRAMAIGSFSIANAMLAERRKNMVQP